MKRLEPVSYIKYLRRIILMLLLVFLSIKAWANQDSIRAENEQMSIMLHASDFRVPKVEEIEKYRQDKRFNYYEKKNYIQNKILIKIGFLIRNFIHAVDKIKLNESIGYLIIIVVIFIIVLLIIKISGVKLKAILGKKELDAPDIQIYNEDVNTINFKLLIQHAIDIKDYRLATRYLYLSNLKLLSEKEIVHWNVNKTNSSYYYEIKDSVLKDAFTRITYIFDYVWYGDFQLNEYEFADVRKQMTDFAQIVENEK